jgi:hypothetical protein
MKKIEIDLDPKLMLDSAILYAMYGREHCKNHTLITGVARLKMAQAKLDRVIQEIDKKIEDNKIFEEK